MRERAVARVKESHTHRATAAHYRVSVKFLNDMVKLKLKLKRETGPLEPKRQGNPGWSKLGAVLVGSAGGSPSKAT